MTATQEVLERVFNALWREDFSSCKRLSRVCRVGSSCAVMALPGGTELLAPVRGIGSFGLFRTTFPYYLRRPGSAGPEEIETAAQLLELLPDETGMLDQLTNEVRQCESNMQIYLAASAARRPKASSFLAGVFEDTPEGLRPEEYLETWILRGHPVHPGCKTRWGFSDDDVRRYSPELGQSVRLRFAALRRTHLVEAGDPMGARYPASWQVELAGECRARGIDSAEYEWLAVHPWQAERVLPRAFTSELERRDLVPLETELPAHPLASIRTMVPLAGDADIHLKLPLAIQSTSALRTVSAPSVRNGPSFSRWIRRVLEEEPALAFVCEVLDEPRGLHFWEPGKAEDDATTLERAKNLSLLFRRRPPEVPGLWTVPAGLLAEPSPIDGRPIVCELADGDPGRFFERYVTVTAQAVFPFFFRGLALEAHGQNCLMRFRDGDPVSLTIRDLGGLRVLAPWAREFAPLPLHRATAIHAREPEELVAKLHHAWLHGHLAPVARALSEGSRIPERLLWRRGATAIRHAWGAASEAFPWQRVGALEASFFRPRIKVKALMRMRLNRRYNTYDFCEVTNPLVECDA